MTVMIIIVNIILVPTGGSEPEGTPKAPRRTFSRPHAMSSPKVSAWSGSIVPCEAPHARLLAWYEQLFLVKGIRSAGLSRGSARTLAQFDRDFSKGATAPLSRS